MVGEEIDAIVIAWQLIVSRFTFYLVKHMKRNTWNINNISPKVYFLNVQL
jgi:hypothetical protein